MPLAVPATRFARLRASDTYKTFSGTITTTGTITAWNPGSDKFQLKGWHAVGIVKTELAATNPVIFSFYDQGTLLVPLFGMEAAAPVGVQFESGRDIGEGALSAASGNDLILKPNFGIGAGEIYIEGMVWGEQR